MSETKHTSVAIIDRETLPEKMHPVVRAAMAQSPDPETLRELLAVQREFEAGEARKAFTRALVDLKRDLPTVIARDKTVAFGSTRYTHTSLAAAMDAVTGPLTMHGFSLSWVPKTGQDTVSVTCRLTHAGGHTEEATLTAPPDNKGSKSPAQGIASTITLLSRYSCLALLGIATADMPEPQGEPEPDHVDSKRNMRAIKAVFDAGRTREAAEALIGRNMREWTAADLDKLREWLKPEPAEESGKPSLSDLLEYITKAQTTAELEAVVQHVKGASLNKADTAKARAAYKKHAAGLKS